jgi:hypothetical protein
MSDEVENMRKMVEAIRAELDWLNVTLQAVESDQWFAPPREPVAGEDVKVRSSGYSDPTGDTASDPVRLGLRGMVQTAEGVVRHSLHQIRGVRVGLQNRHSGWEKGRVQKGKGLPDDGVLA